MDFRNTDWVSLETAKKAWARCRPSVGDILLVCVGATTGRLCVLREARDMVLVRSVALIRPTSIINVGYLSVALQSPMAQSQIWKNVKVSAQPCLYLNRINSLLIPVPPIFEQSRIVAKVKELMGLCDEVETAQHEREIRRDRLVSASHYNLNNGANGEVFREHANFYIGHLSRMTARTDQIKQLRQTILNVAVRGQLVPQDPSDEPASELHKHIQAERSRLVKEGKIREQRPHQSLSPEEVPFEEPEHWKWLRLGDIGFTQTGTTPSSNNPEYFGTYIPFVKPADLTGNITNYFGAGLSKQGVDHSRLIPKNSALMVCIGSSIGKVNVTDRDICCNQQINAITPYVEFLTTFISFALRATYFQKLVLANAGMGTLPIISKGKWEILPVPLPPLPEQHRIVAKVDELMGLCDRLEAQLTTTRTERRSLLEAVLHQSLG
jgi:type I restriction enzyme, S subunit